MALSWPTLNEGQWNKVASGVVSGTITMLKSQYTYWRTSVAKDATAPTDAVKEKSPVMFLESNQADISSQSAIDIYIWIEDADTDTDATGITNAIEVDV